MRYFLSLILLSLNINPLLAQSAWLNTPEVPGNLYSVEHEQLPHAFRLLDLNPEVLSEELSQNNFGACFYRIHSQEVLQNGKLVVKRN